MAKQGYSSAETEETLDLLVLRHVLKKTDSGVQMS